MSQTRLCEGCHKLGRNWVFFSASQFVTSFPHSTHFERTRLPVHGTVEGDCRGGEGGGGGGGGQGEGKGSGGGQRALRALRHPSHIFRWTRPHLVQKSAGRRARPHMARTRRGSPRASTALQWSAASYRQPRSSQNHRATFGRLRLVCRPNP